MISVLDKFKLIEKDYRANNYYWKLCNPRLSAYFIGKDLILYHYIVPLFQNTLIEDLIVESYGNYFWIR